MCVNLKTAYGLLAFELTLSSENKQLFHISFFWTFLESLSTCSRHFYQNDKVDNNYKVLINSAVFQNPIQSFQEHGLQDLLWQINLII